MHLAGPGAAWGMHKTKQDNKHRSQNSCARLCAIPAPDAHVTDILGKVPVTGHQVRPSHLWAGGHKRRKAFIKHWREQSQDGERPVPEHPRYWKQRQAGQNRVYVSTPITATDSGGDLTKSLIPQVLAQALSVVLVLQKGFL